LMVAPTTALPGINLISSYSTSLWRSVGFPESDSLTITVLPKVVAVRGVVLDARTRRGVADHCSWFVRLGVNCHLAVPDALAAH
jgi:hypothetical protein